MPRETGILISLEERRKRLDSAAKIHEHVNVLNRRLRAEEAQGNMLMVYTLLARIQDDFNLRREMDRQAARHGHG